MGLKLKRFLRMGWKRLFSSISSFSSKSMTFFCGITTLSTAYLWSSINLNSICYIKIIWQNY